MIDKDIWMLTLKNANRKHNKEICKPLTQKEMENLLESNMIFDFEDIDAINLSEIASDELADVRDFKYPDELYEELKNVPGREMITGAEEILEYAKKISEDFKESNMNHEIFETKNIEPRIFYARRIFVTALEKAESLEDKLFCIDYIDHDFMDSNWSSELMSSTIDRIILDENASEEEIMRILFGFYSRNYGLSRDKLSYYYRELLAKAETKASLVSASIGIETHLGDTAWSKKVEEMSREATKSGSNIADKILDRHLE